MLSPELDLLEILSGQDESLRHGLLVFGPANDTNTIGRARNVIGIYAKSGLVQLIRITGGVECPLEEWEVHSILSDDYSWTLDTSGDHYYLLRLTEKGYQAFAEDSEGFYEKLFSRR